MTYLLQNKTPEQIVVNTSKTILQLELQNIADIYTAFVTFQVHTQWRNVTVSLDPQFSVGKAETGSNVGVVTLLGLGQHTATSYVQLDDDYQGNETAVTLLVIASTHTMAGKLPGYTWETCGGCTLSLSSTLKWLGARTCKSTLIYRFIC